MKNLTLLLGMTLFASFGIGFAQSNLPDYYTGVTSITGEGYVYNIRLREFTLRIDNALNKIIINKPPRLPEGLAWGTTSFKNKDAENYLMSIALEEIKALSKEFKEESAKPQGRLAFNNSMLATLAVDPRTGEIMEVYFAFCNTPITKTFHSDKLYKLEQYIKQNIRIPAEAFDSDFIARELVKYEWFLTKMPFKFNEMYPL